MIMFTFYAMDYSYHASVFTKEYSGNFWWLSMLQGADSEKIQSFTIITDYILDHIEQGA